MLSYKDGTTREMEAGKAVWSTYKGINWKPSLTQPMLLLRSNKPEVVKMSVKLYDCNFFKGEKRLLSSSTFDIIQDDFDMSLTVTCQLIEYMVSHADWGFKIPKVHSLAFKLIDQLLGKGYVVAHTNNAWLEISYTNPIVESDSYYMGV